MPHEELDRDDPEVARKIVEELCPQPQDRRLLMTQLLESIQLAEQVALFVVGEVPVDSEQVEDISPCTLRNAPNPSYRCIVTADKFRDVRDLLQGRHAEYVRGAAVSATGKPRRASYARYHSPGLFKYATSIVQQEPGAA